MLIDEKIKIEINHRNYKNYRELGYEFDDEDWKGNKEIFVDQKDVMHGVQRKTKLHIRCDYCNNDYYAFPYSYYQAREIFPSDCCSCKACRDKRKKEIWMNKYGTTSWLEISKMNDYQLGRFTKYSADDICDMAKYKGYEVLGELNEHIILKDRISLRCKKHGIEFDTSIGCFMNKDSHNCCECDREYMSEVQREATIEEALTIMDTKGYELVSPDFIRNCDQPIFYICNKHPEYGVQRTTLYGLRRYENNCKLCHSLRGAEHYNWKGGVSSERDKEMSGFEYRRWVRDVFKRDNYTCQCCGKHGGTLNAHHINNYSSNPELRTDINNGISLCEECHLNSYPNSFHKIYGVYDNDLFQLQEFFDFKRKLLGLPLINIEKDILYKCKSENAK